jgi:hypothetical protein
MLLEIDSKMLIIKSVPKAKELVAEAEKAESDGNKERASEFYM